MDPLESMDFSSFIIFSDDPWSLLVSFCQLFKLPLVVQCCNVICEWPLNIIAIAVLEMQKVAQSLHNDKKQLTRDEEVNLLELRGPDPVVCPALVGARLPPGHRLQGRHRGHGHRAGGLPAW